MGRFVDRDIAEDTHVAGHVVLVARLDDDVDEFVGLGGGDALLAATDVREEAMVDRRGDLLTEANRLIFVTDYESERTTLERDAAAEDAALGDGGWIGFGVGRRIDEDRAFGGRQQIALPNLLAEHCHFGQTSREEIAVAKAGSIASLRERGLRRRSDRLLECRVAGSRGQGRATYLTEPSISLGFATFRLLISASNSARCGDGGGSEPVPAKPVTIETASIFTGLMP